MYLYAILYAISLVTDTRSQTAPKDDDVVTEVCESVCARLHLSQQHLCIASVKLFVVNKTSTKPGNNIAINCTPKPP